MPVRKPILQLFFLFCLLNKVYSQLKFDNAVVIGEDKGLPTSDLHTIRKDADGFIWIGTFGEGLCRFDGQSIKVYKAGTDLSHSVLDNFITSLLPVKSSIWIGTHQGLSILNTKTNTFRHYQLEDNQKSDTIRQRYDQTIQSLYRDASGILWIGTRTRGLCCYDAHKDNFRFFPVPRNKYPRLNPSLGTDEVILNITESKTNDSIIWAGTTAGLQKVNKYSGDVTLYTFPKKNTDYQIAINAFLRLYHHDDGLLYVGSWAAGINVFDPVSETFTPLIVNNSIGKEILNAPTNSFTRKSDHEIWITSIRGLAVYDTKLHEVTWAKLNNSEKNEFYGIEFIDEANRVWYSGTNGLLYFDPAIQQFSHYSYKSLSNVEWNFTFYILTDKSGNHITVCPRQTDGIFHFDKIKKEWTKTRFPGEGFRKESQSIRGFVQLQSGDYLISSDRGMFLFSERNKLMKSLQLPFSMKKRAELISSRSGYIWMPYEGKGLVKWDPITNNYTIYQFTSTVDSSNLPDWIAHLFEDSKGNVWFQSSNGLGVFVAARQSIVNFSYLKNEANSFPVPVSFAEDKEGRVWINNADEWIGYGRSNNPEKGVVSKINLKERQIDGSILQLSTDNIGQVWGYTSKELVKIKPEDLSFTTYSFQYGVKRVDFYHFSFLPSGEMIFGGRGDITISNPAELKRNKELPFPYIERMEVLNQPYEFAKNGEVTHLNYKQNFFSIGFSAMAFTMPEDVKFRYRLKGFDEWSEITSRRFANYTNVPGGDYVFQLQAANNEGVWNPKIIELPVHVDTPFWLTWWFRIAAIALLAIAVYSLYRYRLSLLRRKQEVKSEYEKKLANVEMTALLAQMNPHFIFNSLNSIDSYIIRNESKQASEYLNNFARLMRLILQNSRSNYITLKDELVSLELYLQMESLRFKNKFSYSIDVDEGLDTSTIVIPPMLIQPYVENAIWHGLMSKSNGETGKVELNIYSSNDNLCCVISDNGIGRKKAGELKEKRLSTHKRSMGMQITQDRIEIINKLYNLNTSVKIVDLQNENGESMGTRVELIIPI